METLKTIFGGKKLIFNDYVYIKDRHSNEAPYWRCEKRGICNARMTTFRLDESVKNIPLPITIPLIFPLFKQQGQLKR